MLKQKIVDKKMFNSTKSEENSKNELDNAKAQWEALSLEIVDLQIGKCIPESNSLCLGLYHFSIESVLMLLLLEYNFRSRREERKEDLAVGRH